MSPTEQIEIERKYDVDGLVRVPDLTGVASIGSVEQQDPVAMRAVYLDSPDHVLLANRVTLRRREGGHDQAWHLKLPADLGARREVHEPLGDDPDEPLPTSLRNRVEVILRGRPVHPVLVLETSRTITRLLDADGAQIAELADDVVTATRPDLPEGAPRRSRSWREWEVELVGEPSREDGESLLASVEEVLERAGASVSSSKSKLARGLGETPAAGRDVPASKETPSKTAATKKAAPKKSAATFVLARLGPLVEQLHLLDPLVREGNDEAVHRFRTTLRRLRSVLRVFRGVVDDEHASALEAALQRIGGVAGSVRDLTVAGEQLHAAVERAPHGFVSQETIGRIEARLREDARDAHADLVRVLGEAMYFEALDRLDAVLGSIPSGEHARDGATEFVESRLHRERRRARTRVAAAFASDDEGDADDEDDASAVLHRARKAARRLRYAREAARAAGLGIAGSTKAARRLHDGLGDALDAAAAVQRYEALAATARWAGEDTFGYGVLATMATAAAHRDSFQHLRRSATRL